MGQLLSVEDHPLRMSELETFFLLCFLLVAGVVIGLLMLLTWFVQLIVSIASDPNAGPYRQVR